MAKSRTSRRVPSAATSRMAAKAMLHEVLRRKRSLDEALELPALATLDRRDRGFAHALVAATLRHLGQIDALLKTCLSAGKPPSRAVQDVLRLGVAQLVFLGTPPHAAVDSTVELARAAPDTIPFHPLINAVLRRIATEGATMVATQDAARLNLPDWLWESWRAAYGEDTARMIARVSLAEAPLDISVKADAAAWAETLHATRVPTGSLRLDAGTTVTDLPGFAEGAWWVQDAAAALPARLLGDMRGARVFDLCAAPGGKTAQLAAMGARVIALDRSDARLARLRDNMTRLGFSVETVVADLLAWTPGDKAGHILLDAPCSATGTLRRHPDILRLKTADDVTRLADLQTRLLDHTVESLLAPGGTLVYAVCSLQPEEGPHQIAALLKRHPRLRRAPITAMEIGGESGFITPDGDLRCLPHLWAERGGLDGFYAARLVSG